MASATEIYICRPGQAIREGKVEYSTIETRDEAEADAARRVRADPAIAKIAYYAVNEDGDFRCLYSFDNPRAGKAPKPRTVVEETKPKRRTVQRPPSLLRRLRAVFEED